MHFHDKTLKERAEILANHVKGQWVCWRRGYHLDGTTVGHWDDRDRCRDCREYRFIKPMAGSWGTKRHNRPWGPKGEW